MNAQADRSSPATLAKCPTGIRGLDEITGGGLPRGRSTLVCGGAGSGKTLLAMEFIVRGIRDYGEPGVFIAFEEDREDLVQNVASLGFELEELIRADQLAIDHIHIERAEIEEAGDYDLDGLFLRIAHKMRHTGAKRIAVDSLEALFSGFANEALLRSELRRLFQWFKTQGLTAVITGEQGSNTLTRHGLEEYISDCVIHLDHRVSNQIATRRLRIVKYRGTQHGTNEYPTMIDEHGLSVLPISSVGLDYTVSSDMVSSGIARLDAMLGGEGYYRGSTVLISGTAGTGKTSLAAVFAEAVCQRGGRCLYFAFEEPSSQILRNMTSIGLDLATWVAAGRLRFQAIRSTAHGLEQHLVSLHKLVNQFQPDAVVIDPISNLIGVGDPQEVKSMLARVIDFLKANGITTLMTSLEDTGSEETAIGISSLMDTWLLLRNIESNGERNRLLFILKSRGMAHSNQVREFVLSNAGIRLTDVYTASGSVLTGSARLVREAQDQAEETARRRRAAKRKAQLALKQHQISQQMELLQQQAAALEDEHQRLQHEEQDRLDLAASNRRELATARQCD